MKKTFQDIFLNFASILLSIPAELRMKLPVISDNEGFDKAMFIAIWYKLLSLKISKLPNDELHLVMRKYKLVSIFYPLCERYLDEKFNRNVFKLKIRLKPDLVENINEAKTYYQKQISSLIDRKRKVKPKNHSFKKEDALEGLKKLNIYFKENELSLFLISGTFLGAVREKDFISNDYDVDLGFYDHEITTDELVSFLSKNPDFNVKRTGPNGYIVVVKYKTVYFDLFNHYKKNQKVWHSTQIHSWWNTPFDLSEYSLAGEKFLGPQNFNLYLEENYGNWREPSLYYHFSFDTPNRIYNQSASSLVYLATLVERGLPAKDSAKRFEVERALEELDKNFDLRPL